MSIKIEGHRIWRGGSKIGYVEEHKLYNEDGEKVAYWEGEQLYDAKGHRVLKISGNRVIEQDGSDHDLDDMIEDIPSASLPEIARVAIKAFFGD